MKKQKMIIAMVLIGTLILSACGSEPQASNEQPTQDVNQIYTQAAETAQAQQATTEAAKPSSTPTQVSSPTSAFLATNTPLVFDQATPTFPELPTFAAPPTFTPLPDGGNAGTNPIIDGRPCLRAELVTEDVPDGTVFGPEKTFKKTWRLGNSGHCPWTNQFSIVWVDGINMAEYGSYSFEEFDVDETGIPNGSAVYITIKMTTPVSNGRYKTSYMLRDQNGTLFGIGMAGDEVFWVEIQVKAAD